MKKPLAYISLFAILITFLPVAHAAKPEGKGKPDKAPPAKVESAKQKTIENPPTKDEKSDEGERKDDKSDRADTDSRSDEKSADSSEKSKPTSKGNRPDKSDAERKEANKGSEKGQEMREKNSRKWWKFWGE